MRLATAMLALLIVTSCATMARQHCLALYCADEPVETCDDAKDIVVICTEDRVEYYKTVAGWFAGIGDTFVRIGKAVAL